MAQSVKGPTVSFSLGHELTIVGSIPTSGSALSMEPAWILALSPSLSVPPHFLALSQNKHLLRNGTFYVIYVLAQ